MPDDDLFQIIRAAARAGRRSTLHAWMVDNYDQFQDAIAGAGKPNWAELAATFGRLGLADKSGNPPSAEYARQTWWWVRKMRAKAAGKSKPSATSPRASSSPDDEHFLRPLPPTPKR
jgi:hypothetical protein